MTRRTNLSLAVTLLGLLGVHGMSLQGIEEEVRNKREVQVKPQPVFAQPANSVLGGGPSNNLNPTPVGSPIGLAPTNNQEPQPVNAINNNNGMMSPPNMKNQTPLNVVGIQQPQSPSQMNSAQGNQMENSESMVKNSTSQNNFGSSPSLSQPQGMIKSQHMTDSGNASSSVENKTETSTLKSTLNFLSMKQDEVAKDLSSAPKGLVLMVKEPGDSNLIAGQLVDGNLNPIGSSSNGSNGSGEDKKPGFMTNNFLHKKEGNGSSMMNDKSSNKSGVHMAKGTGGGVANELKQQASLNQGSPGLNNNNNNGLNNMQTPRSNNMLPNNNNNNNVLSGNTPNNSNNNNNLNPGGNGGQDSTNNQGGNNFPPNMNNNRNSNSNGNNGANLMNNNNKTPPIFPLPTNNLNQGNEDKTQKVNAFQGLSEKVMANAAPSGEAPSVEAVTQQKKQELQILPKFEQKLNQS